MSSSSALPFRVTVSPSLLGRIVLLLEEFAGHQGIFITNLRSVTNVVAAELTHQESLALAEVSAGYAVVVADGFSVLLQAQSVRSQCQLNLSFVPDAINQFLADLDGALDVGPVACNAATRQTEFTLRLMALCVASPVAGDAAPDVAQLIEQSELLHQVTKTIGQSLELPNILETAVHRVREFLQVDRLLIHQFDIPAPICVRSLDDDAPVATPVDGVTYESCAHDAIPSVLNQMGDHWVNASRNLREKYQSGLIMSKTHIEGIPELAEVLQFPPIAQVKSELTTPILVQGELWGLLIAHQCDRERRWEQANRKFLQQIVDHLSIAIYQARLFSQLQDQAASLEQVVASRTQELRTALMAAQAADVAKSEFLATMSHELRTPLTCIIGMAATLMRTPKHELLSAERQQSHLQIIHDRGAGLLALINDILELSNIESGRTVLNIRRFYLSQLANRTLREIEDKAQAKQIGLVLDLPPGFATEDQFDADPQRVRQILLNLLSNAVKFTPVGGTVTLRIRLTPHGVMFQVEDTGIGIELKQQPLIFQKFQQLDSSYQRKYEGTGLGLALTKQLVELQGGQIKFTSEVDVGSVFTVTLPKQAIDPADLPDELTMMPVYMRVMLVEGSEAQATLMCDLLTAADYQVVLMQDLEIAAYQLDAAYPNIVILNCDQPYTADIINQFCETLKSRQIRLLAVVPQGQSIDDYRHLAADDYLLTTVGQPEQLVDKVMALSSSIMLPTTA
ncbi:GAF domain-containing protein [filamentous cyanobacterium LEGE 11480]|uniref:Circadian input-output histidine kinase CikA n=1 Tax=Romeriopsis navalis LEGE 11480 TaxID=2777977 RepID=A0A928VMR7_9CYAN|nr:ATP-binding protein [Romeriopsis navalis]MBE9029257.1 GAF domain-containing protein [Romeriopsis navalis LEGE 11480]